MEELSRSSSSRRQADHIGIKLTAVGCCAVPLSDWDADRFEFTADEVERLAQMEHERWTEDLKSQGYRYAPGKRDDKRKTHGCLLSWDQLDPGTQEIDRVAVRAIPRLLAHVGLEIRRL